ncbi:hypothetical protein KCP70_22740 [Salmonella enterica subsp. enterica]|nr:hypothetical protein KCP70_22740 [Salmonella enterica subsp. enterica]
MNSVLRRVVRHISHKSGLCPERAYQDERSFVGYPGFAMPDRSIAIVVEEEVRLKSYYPLVQLSGDPEGLNIRAIAASCRRRTA